ncbi:farnesol dehydrogenase-like [Phymastichus coffea]|uniref:farnesol dehydrogenase-like n=1 Tax=Phymastichus coffea TaxID=108790 RepID=UPI00273A93F6|nr:farnesol dehydrogenase-like [Phymastichus coffea]
MDRWAGKVAVITGASSGIGLATAKALVHRGLTVVGLARRKTKMENELKDVKGLGKFYAVKCDVTIKEQVKNAFEWIKTNLKTIDILVNNAGTNTSGSVADIDIDEMKKMLDINFIGVLLCSQLAIKMMKKAGHESHIIMINSVMGLRVNPVPTPNCTNIYAATKFALRALSLTLEKELYDTSIRVTNISPGAVKTELLENMSKDFPEINQLMTLEPEDLADAIIYVLSTPSRVLIEELTIKPAKAPY